MRATLVNKIKRKLKKKRIQAEHRQISTEKLDPIQPHRIPFEHPELLQSLMVNVEIFSKRTLLQFSLLNKTSHHYLYNPICNTFCFVVSGHRTPIHYRARKMLVESNISLYSLCLPTSLTHLEFGSNFNSPVDKLPPTVTHITFGYQFNQPVGHLPPNITYLTFGYDFDQPVDNLPSSITYLTFGWNFNHPVDHLPPNVNHLTFSTHFNQPVQHLPSKITHLTFGYSFNQPVDHLPPTITHLIFGYQFNQPIDYLSSSSITLLTLGYCFQQIVTTKFPHLKFSYGFC